MTDTHSTPGAEQNRLNHLLVSSTALPDEAVALARALGPDASGSVVVEVIDAPFAPSAAGSALRAAHLARELGLVMAVQPLVRYIDRTGVRFPVGKTVLAVLSRFGSAGVDALFELLERSRNAEDRSRITEALARSGAEDERIRTHLVRMLEEDPGFAAPLLAQRGEWRAVPDLLRAFDVLARRPVADCDICAADHLSTIGRAVLALGGRLSDEHSSKIDEAFERAEPLWTKVDDDWAERLASRTPAVRTPRPGRNDPCPCGSGKKYKRCCLGAERGDPQH